MAATSHKNYIQTTAGPIEAEVTGSGIPILILHGAPGGLDGAQAMSRFLNKDKFKTICLSRPGYLNTPLSPSNNSIGTETDLLVALLDTLQIQRVGVLAWSGGGPSAYMLASRYPHRVSALVAIAACSAAWVAPQTRIMDRIMFGTKLGERIVKLAASHRPAHVIEAALESEGSLSKEEVHVLAEQVNADPAQNQLILEIALTMNIGGERKAGWDNDVKNFAAIESLGLEKIECPVLLVHGDADTDAIPRYSEAAHEVLRHSELVLMHRGTHLSFYAHPQASEVQEKAKKWLLDHVKSERAEQETS
jgi:pimeloyl-ACP methyl ester carboxylesterase